MRKTTPIPIPRELLEQCYTHGGQTYPEEACGIISGPAEQPEALTTYHAMENILGRLHAEDPERYPRSPREGFVLDPKAFLELEKKLKEQNEVIRIICHTHPDVGAYFSQEDHKQATWADEPLFPGMYYLVCGIREKQPDGAILAIYNDERHAFDEHPVESPTGSRE